MSITVIDGIMGSGKTSWCVQYMDESPNNFLYITPFLEEVNRIIESTDRLFVQPTNKGAGKMISLRDQLAAEEDIASTHELFKHLDTECQELVRRQKYTLILDEVLSVLEPQNFSKDDVQILIDSGCITIDDDYRVHWKKEKSNTRSTM